MARRKHNLEWCCQDKHSMWRLRTRAAALQLFLTWCPSYSHLHVTENKFNPPSHQTHHYHHILFCERANSNSVASDTVAVALLAHKIAFPEISIEILVFPLIVNGCSWNSRQNPLKTPQKHVKTPQNHPKFIEKDVLSAEKATQINILEKIWLEYVFCRFPVIFIEIPLIFIDFQWIFIDFSLKSLQNTSKSFKIPPKSSKIHQKWACEH